MTKSKQVKKSIKKNINKKGNLKEKFTKIKIYCSDKINYFKQSILSRIIKFLKEIVSIILNGIQILRRHFLPRLIVLFLIWSIFRGLLFILDKIKTDIRLLPMIGDLKLNLNTFFTTILDIWLIAGIIAFFIITLFKMLTEAKNDKI